jgi:hypothetical protein
MLRQILDTLSDKHIQELRYAFENGLSAHVILPDNKFVGVNVEHNGTLVIIEQKGVWAYGELKETVA